MNNFLSILLFTLSGGWGIATVCAVIAVPAFIAFFYETNKRRLVRESDTFRSGWKASVRKEEWMKKYLLEDIIEHPKAIANKLKALMREKGNETLRDVDAKTIEKVIDFWEFVYLQHFIIALRSGDFENALKFDFQFFPKGIGDAKERSQTLLSLIVSCVSAQDFRDGLEGVEMQITKSKLFNAIAEDEDGEQFKKTVSDGIAKRAEFLSRGEMRDVETDIEKWIGLGNAWSRQKSAELVKLVEEGLDISEYSLAPEEVRAELKERFKAFAEKAIRHLHEAEQTGDIAEAHGKARRLFEEAYCVPQEASSEES